MRILAIAGGVLGGLLLLVFLLLLPSVRLHLAYRQGQALVSAHYLFLRFRLFPQNEKPPGRTKKKKPKPEEETPEEDKKQARKKSLADRVEEIRPLLRGSGKTLNRLCRHIIFYRLRGTIAVAKEDAHQTALAYTKTALLLQALLEVLDMVFVLKKHRLTVSPDFTRDQSSYHVSLRVRFRPLFVAAAGIGFLSALLRSVLKRRKKSHSKGGSYESAASHR